MMVDIDARIAKRRRPLPIEIVAKLKAVRSLIESGKDVVKQDEVFLTDQYYRATEPKRIKW